MIKRLFFCITFFTTLFTVNAQSLNFEGEIHYKIEYNAPEGYNQSLLEKQPTSHHIYIRKNLVCRQGPTMLENGYLIEIINLVKKQGYIGYQLKNNAAYCPTTAQELENDYLALPLPYDIEYLNETKNIGGYIGKKALVFMSQNQPPFVVYYTNQIPTEAFAVYQGLKGFPLYYEGTINGLQYTCYASKVNPKPQSDERFKMPSEYKKLNRLEFNAFIRGNY